MLLSSSQQCLLSTLRLPSDAFSCSPSTILHGTSCQLLSSLKKRFVISHYSDLVTSQWLLSARVPLIIRQSWFPSFPKVLSSFEVASVPFVIYPRHVSTGCLSLLSVACWEMMTVVLNALSIPSLELFLFCFVCRFCLDILAESLLASKHL